MLDIGTRMEDYALSKLFKYMVVNPLCGGCSGEIEVDLKEKMTCMEYLVRAS